MDKTNKKMSKKTKRVCIIFMLLFLVGVLVVFGLCFYFSRNKKAEEEIKVGKNQTLLQVQINEIQGNEITFQEVEEETAEDKKPVGDTTTTDDEQKKDQASGDTTKQQEQPGQAPDNKGAGQEMPEMPGNGESAGGQPEMPSDAGNGEMPHMPQGENGGDTERKEASTENKTDTEENKKKDSDERKSYQVKGEEKSMFIPVGTTVTTQLGKQTTFSRLSAGDIVKLLIETTSEGEEVIVGVWMVS